MQPRYLVAMIALAACGDDASTTPVDSGASIDAPADARPDASPDANLGTPLVGTWVKSPDAYADQDYQSVTFRADGTFTIATPDATRAGTYFVPTPGRLRLVTGADFQETSFVTQGDQILLDAVLPQGQVTGVVGTWTTTIAYDSGMIMASLTIAADNTFSGTSTTPSATTTFSGTWVAEGTGLAMTYSEPVDQTEHVRLLGTLGLGPQLLTKQP
jgi:hypothetical protein